MTIDKPLKKPIEAGLIPGVVALAADDRGVIYEGAFGRRAVNKEEPMTIDSVFRIASMTKAVTGAAAMQLVEKNPIARPFLWLPRGISSVSPKQTGKKHGKGTVRPEGWFREGCRG